ncbi:MAG TPA: hypothetical protein VM597_02415 [Gemmataceae bacterium]|nr:hypothetical protein [Gemmataceae bacterium]
MTRLFLAACLVPFAAIAAPLPKGKAPTYYYPTRVGDTNVYETRTGDTVGEYTLTVKKVETADGRLRVTSDRAQDGIPTHSVTVEVSADGLFRSGAEGSEAATAPLLKLRRQGSATRGSTGCPATRRARCGRRWPQWTRTS